MHIYGITSWEQIGDTLILTAAARNVRIMRPDIRFVYTGFDKYRPLLDGNPDFVQASTYEDLGAIGYGSGERYARQGCHIEAQTRMLCGKLRIPEPTDRWFATPFVILTPEEVEYSRQWRGKWLVNANCQTCSVSKGYPHWQKVVDLMRAAGHELVQVGGREPRDIGVDLSGVVDMRGRTTLRQWLAMVHGCEGILTPPSGILHAGAVWDKPMVCLCGARELPALTGYRTVMYCCTGCPNAGCECAEAGQCIRFDGRWCGCMSAIPPEDVLLAAGRAVDVARCLKGGKQEEATR